MSDFLKSSDEEVVKVIREGDKEIFSEIINRYQSKLLRYALYITSDEHLAADAVQEAFIKAYVNLNGFDIKKKFSSWIYRIVHNETINILRKNKRVLQIDEQIDFNSGINLEEDYIKKELVEHVHQCLSKAPISYREPLSLYYLEEKSYEEISDILRLPINTIGTRICRGKQLMKNICAKKTK